MRSWSGPRQQMGPGRPAGKSPRCWVELINLNRSRLVHEGHLDLIYPGRVFVLPAPGGFLFTERA